MIVGVRVGAGVGPVPRAEADAMRELAVGKVRELGPLDGFVRKARSQRCGPDGVAISHGPPGRGLFYDAFMDAHRAAYDYRLEWTKEFHLRDEETCQRFLDRVRARRRG